MILMRFCPQTILALCAGLCLFAQPVRAEERFTMTVPGEPQLTSEARLDGNRLLVTDATGQVFLYMRAPQYDSADRQFLGFYAAEARQFTRWPVTGRGAFWIGSPIDGQVQWRLSRMQLQPVANLQPNVPPLNPPRQVPPPPRFPDFPTRPKSPDTLPPEPKFPGVNPTTSATNPQSEARSAPLGPTAVAFLPQANTSLASFVDRTGQLQFYSGRGDRWTIQSPRISAPLVPGASLLLVPDPSGSAKVYTFSNRGELLVIQDRAVEAVRLPATFPPGATLASGPDPQSAFSVDDRGRIWQLDLGQGRSQLVEPQLGRFAPGGPLLASRGPAPEVFAVDRGGNLVSYQPRGGNWSGPQLFASGFRPASPLASAYGPAADGTPALTLAAVDARGRPHLFHAQGTAWRQETLPELVLPAAAPLALAYGVEGWKLSSVSLGGAWQEWTQGAGRWQPRPIASGFATGAWVGYTPAGDVFGFDALGRPLTGVWDQGRWNCYQCVQGLCPQLVRRNIVPNPPLPPAEVLFENRTTEELLVQIVDRRGRNAARELRLLPGQSSAERIERDPGATLQEVYLVPGPSGEPLQEVRQAALPPDSWYDVVVSTNEVTYRYLDRRPNRGPLPDFDLRTPISLGVFPLPPGNALPAAARLDVAREAAAQRNPGAAVWFPPPQAGP